MLLALAFAAVAVSACGGNDDREAKNAYVKQVNVAQNEFAANVSTVSQRITNKSSSAQDRKTLEQFQSAIDDVVTDLRAIKVPGDVDSEHKQLVGAMSGFGAQIKEAVGALQNPSQQNIEAARKTIATATQTVNVRIDAAIAAINSKLKQK
jgi:gas vesicle protein